MNGAKPETVSGKQNGINRMKNMDQQTLNVMTAKSRADKAINSLKGILQGINIDKKVTEQEIIELQKWVTEHNDLIKRNPFNEFMEIIEQTTADDIPTSELIEDLYWLCQKYEGDNYFYNGLTTDLQTLQGVCHGILADGVIEDEEIEKLHEWINENEHLSSYWPYDEIRSLVLSIVSDKKIEDEERLVLMAFINQFVDIKDNTIKTKISGQVEEVKISGHCTSDPNVEFEGKSFCITGILKSGSRSSMQKAISELGGIPVSSISKNTDYLIVGDNGNPAWAFSCYGRKVEKAVELRKEGHTITLIHEFDFNDILEDNKS